MKNEKMTTATATKVEENKEIKGLGVIKSIK